MTKQTTSAKPRSKPLKRPQQARAKLTVQSIYEAYVRIWQREGWQQLTTRKVALEAGVAVGTFYDYFPNKEALHSGYVRFCIERMVDRVEELAIVPSELSWRERLQQTIQLLCGVGEQAAWFHPQMMELEPLVADHKYQRRAYEEMLALWLRVFDRCTDLPKSPSPQQLEALLLALWGGRRYAMQLQLDKERMRQWAEEMEQLCSARISKGAEDAI